MSDKSDLEKRFEAAKKEFDKEIAPLQKEADDLQKNMIAISEKHGIPFQSNISCLWNNYVPGSFRDLFPELDPNSCEDENCEEDHAEFLYQFDVQLNQYSESGWEHSDVC